MAISPRMNAMEPDPRWYQMEHLLLRMRVIWFGAGMQHFCGGLLLTEAEGQMIGLVDTSGAEAEQLVAEAARRRAYVVVTDFTRPADLATRLRRRGFRMIQRQGTYLFTPGRSDGSQGSGLGRGLLAWLRPRGGFPTPDLTVTPVTLAELPVWNRVCYTAFGARGQTELESLAEKERAYQAMGDAGLWYLARVGREPVGCAILHREPAVAQILAVGTVPWFRGRGVATALVQRATEDWAGNGVLFLDTRPRSQAERLYLKLGFVPAYTRSVYAL